MERMFRLVTLLSFGLTSAVQAWGFQVEGNRLLDANGQPFVMRGLNYPHAWFPERMHDGLDDVASVGANTVRIVLCTGERWDRTPEDELVFLMDRAKELGMVAVLEVHDSTGFGDDEDAAQLHTSVDYWLAHQSVLEGRENYVIINIANEPFGNSALPEDWINGHKEAIKRLRDAGFKHALMVDAANYGQDWEKTMLRHAPEVFEADPLRNTLFSIHMYEVFGPEERVQYYFENFLKHDLCLIVGEFAMDHFGKPVAAEAILRLTHQLGMGMLGWSWSGNNSPLESLDIVVNWDVNTLTPWGDLLINGSYGIRATAQTASVFNP